MSRFDLFGEPIDPIRAAADDLASSIFSSNPTLAQSAVAAGAPVSKTNVTESFNRLSYNKPGDKTWGVFLALMDAPSLTVDVLEHAAILATQKGLKGALEVVLERLPDGINHAFPFYQSLLLEAVLSFNQRDSVSFGELVSPLEMVTWLLEQGAPVALVPGMRSPLETAFFFASKDPSIGNPSVPKEELVALVETLKNANVPLLVLDHPDGFQPRSLSTGEPLPGPNAQAAARVIRAAVKLDQPQWFALLTQSEAGRQLAQEAKSKVTIPDWAAYRQAELDALLPAPPASKPLRPRM